MYAFGFIPSECTFSANESRPAGHSKSLSGTSIDGLGGFVKGEAPHVPPAPSSGSNEILPSRASRSAMAMIARCLSAMVSRE
jgi:hypothetical protein